MKKLNILTMAAVAVMMIAGTGMAQRADQPPREERVQPQRPEGQAPGREGRGAQGREGQGREGQGRAGQGREGQGREGQGREGQGREAQGRGAQGGAQGRGAQGGQRMPRLPIIQALDADQNGEISAKEIANAVAALKKIDANGDGKLTMEEMMPAGIGRGAQGRGAQGRGGEGQPQGRGAQGRGAAGGNTADIVSRIMANDKNGDGKIDKEELPERMQRILERADANKDGALDKGEIEKMLEGVGRAGGNRAGGGDRPARPANGDRPARPANGDRPQRPSNN
ncbi:MAG: hypothetical protein VB877_09235 [Pirellulaceae bacterium]